MPIHLVTGTGGSGVSATAVALARQPHESGVTLACGHDDGSLARWFGPGADAAVIDLSATPAWGAAEPILGGLMEQYGGEGVVAEEWRHLPGASVLTALVRLGTFAAGDDLLVVDLGDLSRAAELVSAAVRLPWAMRHLLGLQAVGARLLGPDLARGVPRGLDTLEAAGEVLTDPGTRLHVVLGADGGSRAKVRRLVPGLLLSGLAPGLLVETGAVGHPGADWLPFTAVRVSAPALPTRDQRAPVGTAGSAAAAGSVGAAGSAAAAATSLAEDDWALDAARLAAIAHDLPPAPVRAAVTRCGDQVTWRLPLPWVRAADVLVEHRGDDLIVTVYGTPHLVVPPAVVRRGVPTHAVLDGTDLVVTAALHEGAWRR